MLTLRGTCLSLALALLLAMASPVRALTLQDLVSGDTLTTSNGLFFHDFSLEITGHLSTSLSASDLSILTLPDGFRMVGPISAADGEVGNVLISYRVDSNLPIAPIIAASIVSNVAASGVGAQAAVDEFILSIPGGVPIALLSAFDTGGTSGTPMFSDEAIFSPMPALKVEKSILVDSSLLGGGFGGSARLSVVDQRFEVVPEPTPLVLMSLGLLGLAGAGRRPRQAGTR